MSQHSVSVLPQPWLARVFVAGTLIVLAGCAARPESVLEPVTVVGRGTSRVDMLVTTTRMPSGDPGKLYSGERGDAISADRIVVSIPPNRNRRVGEIQWPKTTPPNPETDFAVLSVQPVRSERSVIEWFRTNINRKRQALIFVHGFNYTYADAVFRFAQIVHDAGTDAAPVLFTWPSRASVVEYLYDKESTNYSRRALEDLILQAARSPDVGEITILAHSMGTWLTVEALRGVAMRDETIPSKVNNVILASPDIDVDVFRRQVLEMGPTRPHFTLFTSTNDKALELSRWISGGVDRVGIADVTPYAPILKQLGITVIDTSAVASTDPLRHSAFADSLEIIGLLGRQLSDHKLEDGKAASGDQLAIAAIGTANIASSATRATVMAPMTIFTTETRTMVGRNLNLPATLPADDRIPY